MPSLTSPSVLGRLEQATTDGLLDLGRLFPPLATYCPLVYSSPGLHENVPQCTFLLLDCEEAFYGGAVGGGKSAALLMAALQYVDVPGYRALILRRTFAQLSKGDALIPLSHEWLTKTDARWVGSPTPKWTFPSGATIEFGHMQDEKAKYDYQGAAWHFVGFDELTQFDHESYEYVAFSRARRVLAMQRLGVPNRVRSTGNPGGIGHGWVKDRFIQAEKRPEGVVFIPAKMRDNPGLDHDDYSKRLGKLSENRRRQLEEGDWDVFEGQAYPELEDALHAVQGFPPDTVAHWARHESMDHGVTNPTAWLLYLTDYDGNVIVADEYYSPGLPSVHATEILDRRKAWWSQRDDDGWPMSHPCFGDPASLRESLPVADKLGQPLTLEDEYARLGLGIKPGNNRRRAGYVRVRELLQPDEERRFPGWHPLRGEMGAPRLFVVTSRCPILFEQLRNAPLAYETLDPERGEAVDRKWESAYGHAHAALRYGLLGPQRQSEEPVTLPDDPRAARVVQRQQRRAEDWKRKNLGGQRAAIDW